MRIFKDLEGAESIKNAVVTTGSFDGVHVGHKVILSHLINSAKQLGGESTLITFHPHPRKVLYPETAGRDLLLINSQQEKIELLKKTGLQNLIIITFTQEFSKTTSIDFIRKILVGKLHALKIIVGFNHHFGHNREGDYEYLKELAQYHKFLVEEIPEQDIQNESVSSTKIRKALQDGNIQRANAYLDHQYIIMGKLDNGNKFFAESGFPVYSIEIEEECKLIPANGIYAVYLNVNGVSLKGMSIISSCNTSSNRKACVDIHLFEHADNNLKGENGILYFYKTIVKEENNYTYDNIIDKLAIYKEMVEELIY